MKECELIPKSKQFFKKAFWEKRGIAFLVLTCTLVFASMSLVMPHLRGARASGPIVQISPTSSSYPRQIKVIGTNYGANESVRTYWNYTGSGTGILERTATTNSSGGFSILFYVPLNPTGTYIIASIGMKSGLIGMAPFQLLPSMPIAPNAGIAGTQLTLTGNAFGANENVNVYWNYSIKSNKGTLLGTVIADNNGSFTYTFNAPSGIPSGRITLAGIGQSSQVAATTTFTIYPPTLALAPLQGSASTTLTLSAYGFGANEEVNFYWNHQSFSLGTAMTNGIGYFRPTTITVPQENAPGTYAVTAVGLTSKIIATSTFTVTAPNSTISISAGPVGATVNVSGQGYAPGETINMIWNYSGAGTGTSIEQLTADLAGAFVGAFTVPTAVPGSYTVAAIGATSNSVSQNTFSLGSGLAVSLAAASPSTSVTAIGTGFQANELVALYLDSSNGQPLVTATADANGNLSQGVTIPSSATPGTHSLIGQGLTSQITFTATVSVNTNWSDFGFDFSHTRDNTYENKLTPDNVANLTLKWSAKLGYGIWGSPVYANGIVYQASSRGILYAYNATTGKVIWQYNTNTFDTNVSAPLVDPSTNTVFYGTITQLISSATNVGLPSPVYGLNAQTGALKWSVIIPDDEYGFPTLAFNTIYVGSATEAHPGDVLALNVMEGSLKWDYTTHSTWGSVAVDTSTGIVFTGNANPNAQMLALNALTGQLIWQFNVPNSPGDTDIGSGIAVANGLVYANSKNGSVYAISESTGTLQWSTPIAVLYDFADVSSPSLSPNGEVLYVGSTDQNLYALNSVTGAVLWKTYTSNAIASSPAYANGVVYFADTNNSIYAVNAATGNILWSYATGALSYSSPIIVNGWLYCGSDDGMLYAFSL